MTDNLSAVHFRTVLNEIEGRFFSQEEADRIKEALDRHIVTDPHIRAEAAKSWMEE